MMEVPALRRSFAFELVRSRERCDETARIHSRAVLDCDRDLKKAPARCRTVRVRAFDTGGEGSITGIGAAGLISPVKASGVYSPMREGSSNLLEIALHDPRPSRGSMLSRRGARARCSNRENRRRQQRHANPSHGLESTTTVVWASAPSRPTAARARRAARARTPRPRCPAAGRPSRRGR
jgi:hypothetical protein